MFIRAISVTDHGNGLFEIQQPFRELSQVEMNLLRNLFPNLQGQIEELLVKEQMLESILPYDVARAELQTNSPAIPTKNKSKVPMEKGNDY